jgi:hypothetical protein
METRLIKKTHLQLNKKVRKKKKKKNEKKGIKNPLGNQPRCQNRHSKARLKTRSFPGYRKKISENNEN